MLGAIDINKINDDKILFSNKIIEINNLSFKFDNGKELFKNINFSLDAGDFACIFGKNGSGKSTLLKLILNLIENTESKIKINTTSISYIPQSINFNKDFPITVKEFLKYNSKELKVPFAHAKALIEKYDLSSCLNLLIGKLSGGQLQKLMLVRSLLRDITLLIVDEPTNNLDEESKIVIYDNLKELNDQNITILVVEHNKDLAVKYSNKVFHIGEGKLSAI